MATASIPVEMIEKDLTCSICLNLIQDPKDLDCPHTFCFECLKQYVRKKPTIECPECRYITIVPEGGLSDLKSNLRLKSMVENFIKGTSSRSSRKQVVPEIEVPVCQYHRGERKHFFCVTCNISICHNCVVLKHPKPQHEIRELRDVMEEEEKERIKKTQQLDDVERKLKSAKDKAEQEVKSCIQHANAEMKNWEKKMNQEIQTTYQKRMKILQDKHIELQRSARAIGTGTSAVIGMSGLSIQDDELLHDMTILHFVTKQLDLSGLGELVTSDYKKNTNMKIQATSANQKLVVQPNREVKLTLLTEFGAFNTAQCVAANQSNQIAVIESYYEKKCIIYGECNGEYKQQCQIRLDGNASSVGISSQGKLFVTVDNKVKVFSSAGRYERLWPAPGYAGKITITPDDMVVIASKTLQSITAKYIITVYQCGGGLIRRYQEKYNDIRCIASNGKQIAFTTDGTVNVHVIDFGTGHTLWRVNMSNPCGICYVQYLNTLLVSSYVSDDSGQYVIEQYCSTTGRLISRLTSCLNKMRGMNVTQDNKLVVAGWNTVKIYDIK